MAQNGKLISKTNLEAKASSEVITLAKAKTAKLKISASTEFIAQIAMQLGMNECVSVYADRAYIADATVIAINELLG